MSDLAEELCITINLLRQSRNHCVRKFKGYRSLSLKSYCDTTPSFYKLIKDFYRDEGPE